MAVAASVRQEIVSGKWPLQARLPTDQSLAREHCVGLNTVRRALGLLVEEGLVERRRGSGSIVVAIPGAARSDQPMVGLMVPSTRWYYPDLIAGVEQVVGQAGGHVLLRSTEQQPAHELALLDDLVARQPTALILVPTIFGGLDPRKYLRRLESLGLPLVLAERVPAGGHGRDLSWVATDTRRGGEAAVRHLTSLGRRRIGLLSSRDTATSEELYAGFSAAVAESGARVDRAVLRQPEFSDEELVAYAERVRRLRLDGLVCLDDMTANRLLGPLSRQGIRVPDDLAVIAYENSVTTRNGSELSTIEPPRFEVGRLAAQVVLRALEVPDPAVVQVSVAPRLVVRSSTGDP